MDETTFRILDTLATELGTEMSIHSLTQRIGKRYGSAYYVNIYRKCQQLSQEEIISLNRVGKSLIVSLNFKEYMITDLLTEIEFRKKQALLKSHRELRTLFLEVETYCRDLLFVRSVSIIRPDKNAKLNRAELLFLVRAQGSSFYPDLQEAEAICNLMLQLQSVHSMKIDFLILTDTKFLDMLASSEANPAKEMISDKIGFFNPQNYWNVIKVAAERDIPVRAERTETVPTKISEVDLAYNLARFGYTEIGTRISAHGKDICVEYVAVAVLAQRDARRIEAIPVILAKSSVNFDVLLFLSQKYRLSERMMGLLRVLSEVIPRKDLESLIRVMEAMKIKEIPADRQSILEKMRLYNAIR